MLEALGIEADDRDVAWVLDANEALDVMHDVEERRRTEARAQQADAAASRRGGSPAARGRRRPSKPPKVRR